jgi:hypothetical protein
MKLADTVFRDLRLFIDTFTAPENADELYDAVKDARVKRWGVADPGEGGRIVVGVSADGTISIPKYTKSDPTTWVVFFSFFNKIGKKDLSTISLSFPAHHWANSYEGSVNSGIEVPLLIDDCKLELIKAAGR